MLKFNSNIDKNAVGGNVVKTNPRGVITGNKIIGGIDRSIITASNTVVNPYGSLSSTYINPEPIYCAEALALFARMITKPSTALKIRIHNTIELLKSAGLWSKFDIFYYFGMEAADQAILNWVSPSYNVTVMNSCRFISGSGFEGDGISMWLRSEYIPTYGVNFQTNNASVGSLFFKMPTINLRMLYGTRYSTAWMTAARWYVGGVEYIHVNQNVALAVAGLNHSANKLYVYNRPLSNTIYGYENGGSKKTISANSTGRSTSKMAILASLYATNAELFADGGVKLFFMGASLNDTENMALANILLNI